MTNVYSVTEVKNAKRDFRTVARRHGPSQSSVNYWSITPCIGSTQGRQWAVIE